MNLRTVILRQQWWIFMVIAPWAALLSREATGQLAITEVMSSRVSRADFFELTNFGTNVINLAGYEFTDGDHRGRFQLVPANSPTLLRPLESMIFVRTDGLDPNLVPEFFKIWGGCLRSNLQVRFYGAPGFSSFGDQLTIFDKRTHIVDHVDYDRAPRPASFVYDPSTGEFGLPITAGQSGACGPGGDGSVGSPGETTGPIPLQIIEQPENIEACFDLEAEFSVKAIGMPRPRFQWLFNGVAIPGADEETLTVPHVTDRQEGTYSVLVFNGLTNILSSAAVLSLRTNATDPVMVFPPLDATVTESRTARFSAEVCAKPAASYLWLSNDVPLPDETNRVLFVRNCTPEMSGTVYCVRAANALGSTSACARLYVSRESELRITEIQSNPNTGCDGHNDWFEITNFGRHEIQMLGYRFSDYFDLTTAVTITHPLVIRPHESIVFVKNASSGSFFDWWGPDQLPANLQVVPFKGFSLGKDGDALYLWNDTAEDEDEYLDTVSYPENSLGRSIVFEPFLQMVESTNHQSGAFTAVECGDVGSPGFTSEPRITGIHLTAAGMELQWKASLGATYSVERCAEIPAWTSVSTVTATNDPARFIDRLPSGPKSQFYRVTLNTMAR